MSESPRLPNIPNEVWEARPLLKDIRDRAHARAAGADVVLATVLINTAAYIPAHVRIDTGVAVPASPTLFGVLASPSGIGKTTGWRVGRDLLPSWHQAPLMLSTGEGLIEGFYATVWVTQNQPGGKEPKLVRARRRVTNNRMAYMDEGESLFKQLEKPGSLVGPIMRSFWSGGDVGQDNATESTRRTLAAGTYTGGLIIGLQPDISGRLLADTSTGTAQRFLWFTVLDPSIPDPPPQSQSPYAALPPCPLMWSPPQVEGMSADGLSAWAGPPVAGEDAWQEPKQPDPVFMSVAPDIRREIHIHAVQRARGDIQPDEHDSQRPVMHAKVAAVLAWMDRRLNITREDWDIAARLLDTSAAVRDALLEHADRMTARERAEKGAERAAISKAETQAEVLRERCSQRVQTLLIDAPIGMSRNELKKAITATQRTHLAEALEDLISRETVVAEPAAQGGQRYRLASGGHGA